MIESMGDRRWLEVEARERVELDLEKVDLMLIADRENIYIFQCLRSDHNPSSLFYLLRPGNSRLPKVGVAWEISGIIYNPYKQLFYLRSVS